MAELSSMRNQLKNALRRRKEFAENNKVPYGGEFFDNSKGASWIEFFWGLSMARNPSLLEKTSKY
jgi:hypothetical protein